MHPQDIPEKLKNIVIQASKLHDLPVSLIYAIIETESGFRQNITQIYQLVEARKDPTFAAPILRLLWQIGALNTHL